MGKKGIGSGATNENAGLTGMRLFPIKAPGQEVLPLNFF